MEALHISEPEPVLTRALFEPDARKAFQEHAVE
jgi:hypothetical protein